MPEIISEKIDTNIKYDSKDNDVIAQTIVSKFDDWNKARQSQLDIINKIEDLLSYEDVIKFRDKDSYVTEANANKFKKIKLKDPSIKRILNTSIANTYNSIYKSLSNIISIEVKGMPDLLQKTKAEAMQKEKLSDIYRKALPKKEIRKGVYNLFVKGEKITHVNWKIEYKNVRRQSQFNLMGISVPLNKWEYKKELKYNGVTIKNIEPEDFVYDTSIDDFEKALKIHRSHKTYQQIISNENYKQFLTDAQREELKNLVDIKTGNENKRANNDYIDHNGMISVLEAEGDFEYNNEKDEKKYLPNTKICIIAGKYVAYFKYNPNVICSYIYCPYETDNKTRRGLPLLAGIVSTSEAITETLNKVNIAIGLSIRPHLFIKGDVFDDKEYCIDEGGTTKLDLQGNESLSSVMMPWDAKSGVSGGLSFIEILQGQMEEQTQRFKLSSGDTQKQARTLGENKMIMQGQNTLFSYDNDKLLDMDIIPMFEKIGEMEANFNDEEELVKYKDQNGEELTAVMDSEIRQADFTYGIMDSQVTTDRKMNSIEFIEQVLGKIAPQAAQQGMMINLTELLNIIGAAYEQENMEKLLQPVPPPPPAQPAPGGMNGQVPGSDQLLPPQANPGMEGDQALPP